MLDKYRFWLWLAFENSGTINDYLKYKAVERLFPEAGEDFGTGKDPRHSAENN